jgi:hypothetical protein
MHSPRRLPGSLQLCQAPQDPTRSRCAPGIAEIDARLDRSVDCKGPCSPRQGRRYVRSWGGLSGRTLMSRFVSQPERRQMSIFATVEYIARLGRPHHAFAAGPHELGSSARVFCRRPAGPCDEPKSRSRRAWIDLFGERRDHWRRCDRRPIDEILAEVGFASSPLAIGQLLFPPILLHPPDSRPHQAPKATRVFSPWLDQSCYTNFGERMAR